MTHWKSWAKVGIWENVDPYDILANEDSREISEARFLLEMVVPFLPPESAGQGPLSVERRAVEGDASFFVGFLDRGDYAKAMRKVTAALADVPFPEVLEDFAFPEVSIEYLQKHETKKRFRGDRRTFHLEQLQHAAFCLEQFDLADPDVTENRQVLDDWVNAGRQSALTALSDVGIVFRGLEDTFIRYNQVDDQWYQDDIGPMDIKKSSITVELTLRALTLNESPANNTKIWHAAHILSYLDALRLPLFHLSAASTDKEFWETKDVTVLAHEIASAAFLIGQHVQSLNVMWIEPLAEKRIKTSKIQQHAADRRNGVMSDNTERVLAKMREFVESGLNPTEAARTAFSLKLGTSENANRKLYYDYKRKV